MSRTLIPVAAALLTTACIPLEDLDGWADMAGEVLEEIRPEVHFQDLRLTALDFSGADGEFVFALDNPNGVGLNLSSFEWALAFGDVPFADGVNDEGLHIEPWGTTEITVPISVDFLDLIDLVGLADGDDQVPWTLTGAFGFDGVFDEVRVPFEHAGDFPALRRPETTLSQLRLEDIDWWGQEANLAVDLSIGNPGGPLQVEEFFYTIELEGHEVASGWLASLSAIDAGETRELSLPIGVDLLGSAAAVVDAVLDDEAGISVGFYAAADVITPFGVVPWDIERDRILGLR